jgi:hypothetical protein
LPSRLVIEPPIALARGPVLAGERTTPHIHSMARVMATSGIRDGLSTPVDRDTLILARVS